MQFTPKTKEELDAEKSMLAIGEADFEVTKATDKISSKGNPMIELQIKVWDKDGKQGTLFDYIVSNVHWKMLQFFASIGAPDLYFEGDIDPNMLVGMTGRAILAVQKDKTGKYSDKIVISEYLEKSNATKNATTKSDEPDDFLDDINI